MDSLVSTDWLAERLANEALLVLDASQHLPAAERDARAEFAEAHIPGARFLDLASLTNPESEVPKALPRREQVEERLAALGARYGQDIVLYDDSAIRTAARAWFILRMYGFENVAILDGGFAKWRAEGCPVEAGLPQIERGSVSLSQPSANVRSKAEMLANLATRAEQVVDARGADRFAGSAASDPHGQQGGHIPGSRNLPYTRLFAEDGTLRNEIELRREFAEAGIDIDTPVVATCGSGVTASVLLFALSRLGKDRTALYDGSWLEWGGDPATPKEVGAAR